LRKQGESGLKFDNILRRLPEVKNPDKALSFKQRAIWTGVALLLYFALSMVPLYGLSEAYVSQFETLSILLAASFGSLITLGIGPIVTGSIIFQLLVGADIIKIDTNTKEGRARYQGVQKLFSIGFTVVENAVYAFSGALPPAIPTFGFKLLLAAQLVLGGFIIMFLDEVVSKWGIGSGISLFIAAGVSREIMVNAFSPFAGPTNYPIGQVWAIVTYISEGLIQQIWFPLITILATVVVFALSIFLQSVKVEIPLSFGRIRGVNIKWPLSFIYTSNIPVILTASLLVSLQIWGSMMFNMVIPLLGNFEVIDGRSVPVSGIVYYLNPPTIVEMVFGFNSQQLLSLLAYAIFMLGGSVLFSVLWVNIGGQDASTVADQMMEYNLGIPGFRRDKRILVSMLERYIKPLAVMGGFCVGLLAVVADLFNALSRGTGILLTVMIIYNYYEIIKRQYVKELPPRLAKIFE